MTKIPVVEDSFTEEKVENIKTESSQESASTRPSVVHNSINFAVKSEKDMVNYEKGDDMSTSIDFVDPIYVDNEYIILAGSNYNWFMIVSELPELAIRSRLVPFKVLPDPRADFKLFLFILPGEGTQLIRKIQSESGGLMKCGYEKPLVIKNGAVYQVCDFGRVIGRTWGQEEWVEVEPSKVEGRDYLDTEVKGVDREQKVVLEGPVSLYDRLCLDVKLGAFKMGS